MEVEKGLSRRLKTEALGEEQLNESVDGSIVTAYCPSDILPKITLKVGDSSLSRSEIQSTSDTSESKKLLPAVEKDDNIDHIIADESGKTVNVYESGSNTSDQSSSEHTEYPGFVCKSCSKFYKSQPKIMAHILENHMSHLFQSLIAQDIYMCEEHTVSFKHWVGFITHNLFKHSEQFKTEKDHLASLMLWVENTNVTFNSVEEGSSLALDKVNPYFFRTLERLS